MRESRRESPSEFNVCGVLVHTRAHAARAVDRRLRALPGVEVHRITGDGRLVVTVEDTPATRAGDTLARVQSIAGVLSAALVYHHCERAEDGAPA